MVVPSRGRAEDLSILLTWTDISADLACLPLLGQRAICSRTLRANQERCFFCIRDEFS